MSEARIDPLFTVREAAEKLSIGKTLFWRLIREGKIEPTRFGTRVWIRESQLANLLDQNTKPWKRQTGATPPRGRGRPRKRAKQAA
jgi:excisionase family DNA binding protein